MLFLVNPEQDGRVLLEFKMVYGSQCLANMRRVRWKTGDGGGGDLQAARHGSRAPPTR